MTRTKARRILLSGKERFPFVSRGRLFEGRSLRFLIEKMMIGVGGLLDDLIRGNVEIIVERRLKRFLGL